MKKSIIAALSIVSALTVSAATFTWDDKGDHLWTTTNNWNAVSLPTTNDTVHINNSTGNPSSVFLANQNAPETNGFANVVIGNTAGSDATLYITDGSVLTTVASTIGASGTGTVVMADSSYKNTSGVGNIILGNTAVASGTLIITNGNLTGSYGITVGASGKGFIEMNGGAMSFSRTITLGSGASGSGALCFRSGTINLTTDFVVGANGVGWANVFSNTVMSVRSTLIGEYASGEGVLIIENGGRVTCSATQSCKVGASGNGILNLRGGIVGSSSGSHFTVRENAGAFGLVRGWGRIHDFRNIRNSGIIVADGDGENRELHMNINRHDGYLSNPIDNEPYGTNGWYAVNNGKLTIVLRVANGIGTGLGYATPEFCWGETEGDDTPDLVNSFRVSFAGTDNNGTFTASVLAPDRDDLPPLPNIPVVGLWNATFTRDFSSVDFECRYDHTRVPSGNTVKLMRWDADAQKWHGLGSHETGTQASPHRVKVYTLPPNGTAERIGLIGAFAVPAATRIIIR